MGLKEGFTVSQVCLKTKVGFPYENSKWLIEGSFFNVLPVWRTKYTVPSGQKCTTMFSEGLTQAKMQVNIFQMCLASRKDFYFRFKRNKKRIPKCKDPTPKTSPREELFASHNSSQYLKNLKGCRIFKTWFELLIISDFDLCVTVNVIETTPTPECPL